MNRTQSISSFVCSLVCLAAFIACVRICGSCLFCRVFIVCNIFRGCRQHQIAIYRRLLPLQRPTVPLLYVAPICCFSYSFFGSVFHLVLAFMFRLTHFLRSFLLHSPIAPHSMRRWSSAKQASAQRADRIADMLLTLTRQLLSSTLRALCLYLRLCLRLSLFCTLCEVRYD